MRYVLPKGVVSVDGCSLTVGEVTDHTFSVYLIPETLRWMRCLGRFRWVGGWIKLGGWTGWLAGRRALLLGCRVQQGEQEGSVNARASCQPTCCASPSKPERKKPPNRV